MLHVMIVLLSTQDLTTLAPRKVDWDLKRDVSKRMEKLERRTQRAIAQLIRMMIFNDCFISTISTLLASGSQLSQQ